jgi:GNAT superfamily N-acetyltransferase
MPTPADRARSLPDSPGWVETRGLLLSGRCVVFDGGAGYLVRGTEVPLVCVVGRPAPEAVRAAVDGGGPDLRVLARPEDTAALATALPGWTAGLAVIHRLPPGAELAAPRAAAVDIRRLGPGEKDLLAQLPEVLREEIAVALCYCPTAAAFVDGRLAAVCYASFETETLWDVSIDTLEPYRRRGLAAHAVACLDQVQRERGKEPVWGADDTNHASLRLAAKLGFVPVDRLMVLAPPLS